MNYSEMRMKTTAIGVLVFTSMLVSGLLSQANGQSLAGAKQEQSQTNSPRKPMIGYIKNEDLVDMCGCAYEHLTRTRGYTFSADGESQEAWMNIDGEDVKLNRTHFSGSKFLRIGSRYTDTYEAPGLKVVVVRVVSRLCRPYSPECETTGYNVTITVNKAGRIESVKAKGQCGCV